MKRYKAILGAFLVGVTVFSVINYAFVLKEKYALLNNLDEFKNKVLALENEKQNLLKTIEKEKESQIILAQDNADLKDRLKAAEDKFAQLDSGLGTTQQNIDNLYRQITKLRLEKTMLTRQKDILSRQLISVKQQVAQLKYQLQEFKGPGAEEPEKRISDAAGNRGFIVRDGQPTLEKIKIEVTPIPETGALN